MQSSLWSKHREQWRRETNEPDGRSNFPPHASFLLLFFLSLFSLSFLFSWLFHSLCLCLILSLDSEVLSAWIALGETTTTEATPPSWSLLLLSFCLLRLSLLGLSVSRSLFCHLALDLSSPSSSTFLVFLFLSFSDSAWFPLLSVSVEFSGHPCFCSSCETSCSLERAGETEGETEGETGLFSFKEQLQGSHRQNQGGGKRQISRSVESSHWNYSSYAWLFQEFKCEPCSLLLSSQEKWQSESRVSGIKSSEC